MTMKPKRGGYRKTAFGELVKSDPELAATQLRGTWTAEQSATNAAILLGISRRSFFRCADRLESLGYDVGRPSGS